MSAVIVKDLLRMLGANDRLGVGELIAASHNARTGKNEAGQRRGVERQDLILGGLDPEQVLQFL